MLPVCAIEPSTRTGGMGAPDWPRRIRGPDPHLVHGDRGGERRAPLARVAGKRGQLAVAERLQRASGQLDATLLRRAAGRLRQILQHVIRTWSPCADPRNRVSMRAETWQLSSRRAHTIWHHAAIRARAHNPVAECSRRPLLKMHVRVTWRQASAPAAALPARSAPAPCKRGCAPRQHPPRSRPRPMAARHPAGPIRRRRGPARPTAGPPSATRSRRPRAAPGRRTSAAAGTAGAPGRRRPRTQPARTIRY